MLKIAQIDHRKKTKSHKSNSGNEQSHQEVFQSYFLTRPGTPSSSSSSSSSSVDSPQSHSHAQVVEQIESPQHESQPTSPHQRVFPPPPDYYENIVDPGLDNWGCFLLRR